MSEEGVKTKRVWGAPTKSVADTIAMVTLPPHVHAGACSKQPRKVCDFV